MVGILLCAPFSNYRSFVFNGENTAKQRAEQQFMGATQTRKELPSNCETHFVSISFYSSVLDWPLTLQFLSHYQSTGGDQVGVLQRELQMRGFTSWLDIKEKEITCGLFIFGAAVTLFILRKESMASGIQNTGCFLLFLSRGVLTRP